MLVVMKTPILITSLISLVVLGCNQKNPAKQTARNADTVLNNCFHSVVAKDSATLKLNALQGKVKGQLRLTFAKKEDMSGELSGTFSGDTLFADFTYKMDNGKETFKNPAAFLRKDGKLYQGYGEIVTQYGRTFFDKKTPITFDRGFVFEPVDCR